MLVGANTMRMKVAFPLALLLGAAPATAGDQANVGGKQMPAVASGNFLPGVAAYPPTPATVVTQQIAIAVGGTAVCFAPAQLQNWAVIKARAANLGKGFVGGSGVTTTDTGAGNGYALAAGEATPGLPVLNASALCVNDATAGDIFYLIGS